LFDASLPDVEGLIIIFFQNNFCKCKYPTYIKMKKMLEIGFIKEILKRVLLLPVPLAVPVSHPLIFDTR